MSWFRKDHGFMRHPKARLAGRAGREVWSSFGPEAAMLENDGLVPGHMVSMWAALSEIPMAQVRRAIKALVASGLWHDHETLCERCEDRHGPLSEGDYRYHDWIDWNLAAASDELGKIRERRRKHLHRNPRLKTFIRERDRDLCRYCGVLTVWGNDHRSNEAGTFDHIDPFCGLEDPDYGNRPDNLVVACRVCNGRKKDRTPTQANMALIDPVPSPYPAHIGPVSHGEQAEEPALSSRDARDGTVRVGNGSQAGYRPDLVSNGSSNGSGPSTNGEH